MFATRSLFSVVKKSTGIYGLPVHPDPRPQLISIYKDTLKTLEQIPSHAVYRQATSALTTHRLNVVEANEDIAKIEKTLDAGQIEEVVVQAAEELKLAGKMLEWKPWEPLETPAPKDQWNYKYNDHN
ncbi:NADH dehydrogenase (ubiquinone) 1 alpha subcomplex subunit 5 [Entomortierella parvispora]|uniref:NADH dehydrogenase (Ubiquinone) 1 alpha subcomplex subunit 5 n=1 Tax=Entomortierella parvispora TaxID=205924 RepID=A0A9P3HKP5_9FUNG|nr:NADH dehydrogenase (ubiquinone) 1 alpha subcomplex subunit 5 [Entomortierella parvispora]